MTVFPSLSTDSFIEDRNIIVSKLIEMFTASFENQSNYYPITSYKYIVNTYEQGSEVANKMETALENLYRVYFDTVTVKVNHDLSKDNSMYLYSIEIIAYYDKVKYEITREMSEDIITKF